MATKLKRTQFQTAEKHKTLEELQKEYAVGCTTAGTIQYQIQALKWDLEELNVKLRSVNIQASKLKAKEQASILKTTNAAKAPEQVAQ